MVFVKPTVHVSRIAGTALKSFTHGYAQTVVAASQSSYASQNTSVTPLANNFLGRFAKSGQSKHGHLLNSSANSNQSNGSARADASHNDSGLAQYYDAWQKHQKGDVREWQQYQFTKRIDWQPPTTVPDAGVNGAHDAVALEEVGEEVELGRAGLVRAYTTSAVDNFAKAIDDEAAEAVAFAQVNEAIAEEVEKSKQDAEAAAGLPSVLEDEVADATSAAPDVASDAFTLRLDELARTGQYAQVPELFAEMLRAGVKQPSQLAYRALLASAMELTPGKHHKVARALEVYSDMLRRQVLPDAETYTSLLTLLAARAIDAHATKTNLEQKRARYDLSSQQGQFLFRSDGLEHAIASEDQSLSIALQIFKTAPSTFLQNHSYAQLILACAKQGRTLDIHRLYQHLAAQDLVAHAHIFPAMIAAFAAAGDLRSAVESYDHYKQLAIANDAGNNALARIDTEVYTALVSAYAVCGRNAAGQRFFAQIQAAEPSFSKRQALLDSSLASALEMRQPYDIQDLSSQMSAPAFVRALNLITTSAADGNALAESTRAFNTLASVDTDLTEAATAMLAMHIRNANVEEAEPYWRIIESSHIVASSIEPTVMRAIALMGIGQATRGLRQSRIMFGRLREAQTSAAIPQPETMERIEEAVEILGRHALYQPLPVHPEASVELLRMVIDNSNSLLPFSDHLVARFGPEQISRLESSDMDTLMQVQSRMILAESAADIAGPSRFACLLENIVSRGILPNVTTENLIEKTLINLNRSELSRLWNGFRYPVTPVYSPVAFVQPAQASPVQVMATQPAVDDSFDPYAARTDNKGSVAITDMLEKAHGRPAIILNEALAKFRNMRRVGRHPRFFAYAKLIAAAAKESQVDLAHDILEMARQDVPYLPQYRVVRYGWVTILDSMLSGCLVAGRRDLAAKYHQDLLEMGAAPSANTYGLYITTLTENTKTFDEATEAVKIFLRAKAEGVEPSSFLYNALIGKLGKARRIDDCLFYFAEMRNVGVRPTSVTYGTIVNALCRVSDEKFAEEIFEEMESCVNYKPRPAPYHSLMQYFLTTKRDRSKVLAYYERMRSKGIQPTMHTYKLLIDTHATLEPIDMAAAEAVLDDMRRSGATPEAVHHASLIHAKGCVLHDVVGARALFDSVLADPKVRPQPCLYQAMFESLVAAHQVAAADALLADMRRRRVEMTPYIANALIHGWTLEKNVGKAKEAFGRVERGRREPSTYEAMVRACLAAEDGEGARAVVAEALSRGYPSAVAGKIADLVGGASV